MFFKRKEITSWHSKKGIILLEVLAACGVLLIAVVSILQAYINISIGIAQTRAKIKAINHILSICEEIRGREDKQILTIDWKNWLSNTLGVELLPDTSINVVVEDSIPGDADSPRLFTITMTYNEHGRIYSVSLTDGCIDDI